MTPGERIGEAPQSRLQVCKRQLSGCNRGLQVCKRQLSGCNRGLQVCKRQLSGCNRDCRSANADCRAAIAIAGLQTPIVKLQLQPLIDVRNPHVVRRHVAIVIAAHNHFPAHFDFIDRSKKSAEVRMSEVQTS